MRKTHRSSATASIVGLLLVAMGSGPVSSADGSRPSPVSVTFGPNVNLSVQSYSQGKPQRETTIAANPNDPMNLVEGNMDHVPTPSSSNCSFSSTTDGGVTWTFGGSVPLEASDDFTGDPSLAVDASGTFYYAYLDSASPPTGSAPLDQRRDLVVAKSTDGGRSFPTLTVAVHGGSAATNPFFPDRDEITVDQQSRSPFKGTLYLAFTNAGFDGYQIMVAVSRDGAASWSNPVAVGPIALYTAGEGLFGALPVVAPDGTAYLFYEDFLFNTGPTSIKFSKSTDGGRTWTKPASVASRLPSPGNFTLKNSDPNWDSTASFGINASSYPTAAIAPNGTIFVAWTDFPNGSCVNTGTDYVPCTNSDVRLSISTNGGKTWTAPVKVSDESNATDQFFPSIAVHPNGLLSLAWQDKRLDPTNIDYDTFYTNTFDGAVFLPNVRVTTESSLPGNGQTEIFDYNDLTVTANGVFPVWSDMRTGNPDVYVAVGRLAP